MELTFGQYKGETMEEVYDQDPSYIHFLATEIFSPPIKKAAQAVIERQKQKDKELREKFLFFVEDKKKRYSLFQKYPFVYIVVQSNYVCFELCTHDIQRGNSVTDVFWEEDWDILCISTYFRQEDKIIFAKKNTFPDEKEKMWYACLDGSLTELLNVEPVTLEEALSLLSLREEK